MDTTLSKSFGGKFSITFTFVKCIFRRGTTPDPSSAITRLRHFAVGQFPEDFTNTLLHELFWQMVETPSLQKYLFYLLWLRFFFSVYLNQNLLDLLIHYFLQVSFLIFFVKRKSSLLGYHLQKSIRQVLNWMIIKLSNINAILEISISRANPLGKWSLSLVMKLLHTTQTYIWNEFWKQLYRVIL